MIPHPLRGRRAPMRYATGTPLRPPASVPSHRPRLAGRFHYTSGSSFSSDPLAPHRLSHGRISESIQRDVASSCRTCRSEEHTSELQSLMRTSYAVFCLKTTHNHTSYQITTS